MRTRPASDRARSSEWDGSFGTALLRWPRQWSRWDAVMTLRCRHRLLLVSGRQVSSLNADAAGTTPVSTMPGKLRLDTEHVWTGTHLVWVNRDPGTPDVAWNSDTDNWTRLPELPDADQPPTYDAVVEPLEGDVLVWGGIARYDPQPKLRHRVHAPDQLTNRTHTGQHGPDGPSEIGSRVNRGVTTVGLSRRPSRDLVMVATRA